MKIGITADLHLTLTDAYPERKNALLDILRQCAERGVQQLIIAGDLFDAPLSSYSEFEAICKTREFSQIQILVIPGNHDPSISNKQIVARNIRVFDQPTCQQLTSGWKACFIPYREGQTMGAVLGEVLEREQTERWALVGHGDWFGSLDMPNPYEGAKTYMPLTRREIELFKPNQVLLGHIHTPKRVGNIIYAGSPCPVTSDELGYRRFLILDTETGNVEEVRVNNDVVFLGARFVLLPAKDEQNLITQQIEQWKKAWLVGENDLDQIRLRVTAVGYSNDRGAVLKALEKGFAGFRFLDDPDISQLRVANDAERNFIIEKFRIEIDQLDYPIGEEGQPDQDEILLQAMDLVYGRP
jgi:DNA repair exonuclease SbcCD nuclease subunit